MRDCRHQPGEWQSAGKQAAVCAQGTVEVYAVEIEDVSRAHDSWKDQAVKLDGDHARKDREIDGLVSLACQQGPSTPTNADLLRRAACCTCRCAQGCDQVVFLRR